MGKFNWVIKKTGSILACMALFATTLSVNQACFFFYHQPKMPDSALMLKKENRVNSK